jgi:predicted amidohydrolase
MIIDPWGRILAELGGTWKGEPELEIVDIDEAQVENVRKQVPLKRRWDVYGRC